MESSSQKEGNDGAPATTPSSPLGASMSPARARVGAHDLARHLENEDLDVEALDHGAADVLVRRDGDAPARALFGRDGSDAPEDVGRHRAKRRPGVACVGPTWHRRGRNSTTDCRTSAKGHQGKGENAFVPGPRLRCRPPLKCPSPMPSPVAIASAAARPPGTLHPADLTYDPVGIGPAHQGHSPLNLRHEPLGGGIAPGRGLACAALAWDRRQNAPARSGPHDQSPDRRFPRARGLALLRADPRLRQDRRRGGRPGRRSSTRSRCPAPTSPPASR